MIDIDELHRDFVMDLVARRGVTQEQFIQERNALAVEIEELLLMITKTSWTDILEQKVEMAGL